MKETRPDPNSNFDSRYPERVCVAGFVEALPRRITMKTFKPTNERCAVIFASPRIGAARWVAPATMLVGGAFMKFNKLILNYVPNCQTGRAGQATPRMPLEFYANRERARRRFVVPPRVINVSGMDSQTDSDSLGHMSCNGSRK